MLSTATHSKLREALDGTDTQVVTCAIDRCMAKMKRTEEYITREISRMRGTPIRKTPESSSGTVLEEEKKNSSSDEAPRTDFDPPPNYAVDDPIPQRSCPAVDEVLAKA